MSRYVLSLLGFVVLLRADFEPARWRYLRALAVGQPEQVCVLTLDRAIYAGSQTDLADLRVVRNGREIPYVTETLAGSVQQSESGPEILDRTVVPGAGLQLTMDLGRSARHNRLRISTGQTNFRTRVRIETSNDGREWAIARNDGYVFDFSQAGRSIAVLAVEYPLSTRRYLRATFFGWMRTDSVTDAWLLHYVERRAVWQTIAEVPPERTEDHQASLLVLDLKAAGLPQERLRLETGGPPFHRACEIESSPDRKNWRSVAQGVLYRFPEDESSTIQFPRQHDRYLRLRIFNGDDQPVPVGRVVVEAVERRLKFLPEAAGDYALYYGNPQAKPPVYDLGTILARRAPAPEILVAAGAEQPNPRYQPSPLPLKPWSERHPQVLYGTLAVAILAMGWVTIKFLMSLRQTEPRA